MSTNRCSPCAHSDVNKHGWDARGGAREGDVLLKAHIHSLTADGAKQQKCSSYLGNPVKKAAATFFYETCLNYLNTHSVFCIRYGVRHSVKYLNI